MGREWGEISFFFLFSLVVSVEAISLANLLVAGFSPACLLWFVYSSFHQRLCLHPATFCSFPLLYLWICSLLHCSPLSFHQCLRITAVSCLRAAVPSKVVIASICSTNLCFYFFYYRVFSVFCSDQDLLLRVKYDESPYFVDLHGSIFFALFLNFLCGFVLFFIVRCRDFINGCVSPLLWFWVLISIFARRRRICSSTIFLQRFASSLIRPCVWLKPLSFCCFCPYFHCFLLWFWVLISILFGL